MARIRTIKPEFWTSEQIILCSLPARILFIGLWNFCDDNGIHPASLVRLKGEVFPLDSFTIDQIEDWINELISNGLLEEYEVDSKKYWIVTGWSHQKIEKKTYKYPKPSDYTKCNPCRTNLDDYSTTTRRLLDESSPPEGKGRESKNNLSPKDYCNNEISKNFNFCEIEISRDKIEYRSKVSIENQSERSETALESKKTHGPISTYQGNFSDALELNSVLIKENDKISKKPDQRTQDIDFIFEHWKLIMSHSKAKLDSYRKRFIEKALKNYSVEEICNAITGCSYTPHNMGDNFDGGNQIYDGLHIILKNSEQIDRFINNCHNPPVRKGRLSSKKGTNNEEEALKALEKLGRR